MTKGSSSPSLGSPAGLTEQSSLAAYRTVVQSYEALIRELRAKLDSTHQTAVDINLSNIRRLRPLDANSEQLTDLYALGTPAEDGGIESYTYVGKVSDIHFIHTARRCMQGHDTGEGNDLAGQSYSQTRIPDSPAALNQPLLIPSRDEAAHFLEIYLSTIHLAYPFLCKQTALEQFEHLWTDSHKRPEYRPWLALFNFIFAIGSYYTSFPHGKDADAQHHFRYFEQGLFFSHEIGAHCSLTNVWVMLVECFFLLAVCHTDRCWNTLGFAIRMAQSIGLHVESPPRSSSKAVAENQHGRRTWYSLYVLDRLLALQLGRPMAIHEEDFKVELPDRSDPWPFGPQSGGCVLERSQFPNASMMDYFRKVIRFSDIVGLVIRQLYRPSQVDLSPDQMLHSVSLLDQHLAEWKAGLPRHLRFDLGHTFERSISFKRQRNMLAVKFHHLRALIYRPFLCLPLLQMNNKPFMDLLVQDKEKISHAEWICISEAQQTAHLLHNVMDERSLVHDFPWWQMISCLICASSILFVAETFYRNNNLLEGRTSAYSLREDAEICLKVFEALSANSVAARKAADMLGEVSSLHLSTAAPSGHASGHNQLPSMPTFAIPGSPFLGDSTALDASSLTPLPDLSTDILSCEWPSEMSNSMEWSVRFLDCPNFQKMSHPGGALDRKSVV